MLYNPTDAEFSNAMEVVRRELATARPSTTFDEDDIRKLTLKVLSICYSIGGDYQLDYVRKVASTYLQKQVNP